MWPHFIILLCVCSKYSWGLVEPQEIFAWKEVDFAWPSDEDHAKAIRNGSFIPANNLPLGIEVWKDKLFIAIPRWRLGVASTLNWVSLKAPIDKSSPLMPYPNWESNYIQENSTLDDILVSTFRVRADECDRLWVMDTGIDNIRENLTRLSTPKLVIFDLHTDKIIKRHIFDAAITKDSVFMANIVVDVFPENCEKAFAYIPDVDGEALIVYSLEEDTAWRVSHHFFHFDPFKGDMTVGKIRFQWPDGVFGLTLSNKNEDGYRTAYFHPLSSTNEFEVSTAILTNKTASNDPNNFFEFKALGDKGPNTQTSDMEFDKSSNIIYFTQLQRDGLACWNTKKALTPENVAMVAEDNEKLVFTNDVRLDKEEPYLYMISNKMPQFMYSKLDPTSVNFRIFKLNTKEAVKDTPCE